MKKIITMFLAVVMMLSCVTVASAVDSPVRRTDLSKVSTKVTVKSLTYNGKAKNLSGKVVVKVGKTTLKEGKDYKLVYSKKTSAGKSKVTVKGIGKYTGSVNKSYTIAKASNQVKAKASKTTVKYSSVKKKATTVTLKTSGKGKKTVTISPKKLKKYVKVSGSKVTLKKGAKKGNYKVTVKYAGNNNYKSGTKTVTIKVK